MSLSLSLKSRAWAAFESHSRFRGHLESSCLALPALHCSPLNLTATMARNHPPLWPCLSFPPSQAPASHRSIGWGEGEELRIFLFPVVALFTCLGIYHPPSLLSLARALTLMITPDTNGTQMGGQTVRGGPFMAPHAVGYRSGLLAPMRAHTLLHARNRVPCPPHPPPPNPLVSLLPVQGSPWW